MDTDVYFGDSTQLVYLIGKAIRPGMGACEYIAMADIAV